MRDREKKIRKQREGTEEDGEGKKESHIVKRVHIEKVVSPVTDKRGC